MRLSSVCPATSIVGSRSARVSARPASLSTGNGTCSAFDHLALVRRVLRREAEHARAERGELRVQIAKPARVRRAAARARDLIPVVDQRRFARAARCAGTRTRPRCRASPRDRPRGRRSLAAGRAAAAFRRGAPRRRRRPAPADPAGSVRRLRSSIIRSVLRPASRSRSAFFAAAAERDGDPRPGLGELVEVLQRVDHRVGGEPEIRRSSRCGGDSRPDRCAAGRLPFATGRALRAAAGGRRPASAAADRRCRAGRARGAPSRCSCG